MSKLINDKEYKSFFTQVKEQIKSSQAKAVLSVNASLILCNWNLGKMIVEKQEENSWGSNVIEQLAKDLRAEFPGTSGFSRANLFSIRQFYLFYMSEKVQQLVGLLSNDVLTLGKVQQVVRQIPDNAEINNEFSKLQQLVALIPWGHHIVIIAKVKDPEAALFYIQQTIEHNWSRAVLIMQMEQNLFGRQGKAITNFTSTLSEQQALLAQQLLKDPYNFNFLRLEPKVQELELEKQLTEHITKFLLELGKGFAFIGRQYPISIGKKDYSIDLLFYHIRLRCFVVIELLCAVPHNNSYVV